MSKKIRITTALLLLLLAGLSACQRPYSKAPVATPQVIGSASTPLPVDQQILNATMTAQAIMEKFNQPTVMVTNAQGTAVVATAAGILLPTNTPVPPTARLTTLALPLSTCGARKSPHPHCPPVPSPRPDAPRHSPFPRR